MPSLWLYLVGTCEVILFVITSDSETQKFLAIFRVGLQDCTNELPLDCIHLICLAIVWVVRSPPMRIQFQIAKLTKLICLILDWTESCDSLFSPITVFYESIAFLYGGQWNHHQYGFILGLNWRIRTKFCREKENSLWHYHVYPITH